MLDAQSPVPLYFQLKTLLGEQIQSGALKPGEKIPSEHELCRLYQISRTTARQAVNELVRTGRLVRTQGRGTFVADFQVNKPVTQLTGFTQDMRLQGLKPHSKVLQFSAIIPPPETARALQLHLNEAAIFLKRLRCVDDQPLGLDMVYLSFNRFHEFLNEDMEDRSLYEVLREKFNIVPTRSINTIQAIPLAGEVAGLLDAPEGTPALYQVEYIYDQDDRLFEYCINYYRGDHYVFHIEISKYFGSNIADNNQKIVKSANLQNR